MADNELSQEDVDSLLGNTDETPPAEGDAEQPVADAEGAAESAEPTGAEASQPEAADAGAAVATAEKVPVDTQPVEFAQLVGHGDSGGTRKIDFLLDVPVTVTVELGRTSMVIRDALSLGGGSVVELNKLAGEPVDVLINSKLVARAEVVVVNENFGVKVIDIVSPEERLRYLR